MVYICSTLLSSNPWHSFFTTILLFENGTKCYLFNKNQKPVPMIPSDKDKHKFLLFLLFYFISLLRPTDGRHQKYRLSHYLAAHSNMGSMSCNTMDSSVPGAGLGCRTTDSSMNRNPLTACTFAASTLIKKIKVSLKKKNNEL